MGRLGAVLVALFDKKIPSKRTTSGELVTLAIRAAQPSSRAARLVSAFHPKQTFAGRTSPRALPRP